MKTDDFQTLFINNFCEGDTIEVLNMVSLFEAGL